MTGIVEVLSRFFAAPAKAPDAYDRAMSVSGNVLQKMEEASESHDAARAVMAGLWLHSRNVPFMTTVYQAVEEVSSGIDQKPTDQ